MGVYEAVERDLADIRALDADLADSALGALALALAEQIDGDNSATSKSMCAGQLRETLSELRALAPEKRAGDRLDALNAGRTLRLAGVTAT